MLGVLATGPVTQGKFIMKTIAIDHIKSGVLIREGAGVKLHRYLGVDPTNEYEPILLFDFFDSSDPMDFIAGFPPHPHRGFETVTYLLAGQISHEDNHGHKGLIGAGDVQWMTAGRGIIHAEMPQKAPQLTGLQLWLNLPAADKMKAPNYHEVPSSQLPVEYSDEGVIVKVIAGETASGTRSPITGIATEPLFLDIKLPAGQQWRQKIPLSHQALVFVLEGEVEIAQQTVMRHKMALLTAGEQVTLQAHAEPTHCLLIAAKKLHEPIARLGPFVMNTQQEVLQALEDFRNNRF